MSEAVFATGPEELLDPETRQSLTGLEVMQGILEGRFPHPPICKVLGFRLSDVAYGRVRFEGAPGFDVCNPHGTVHGGWYGTLLDSAMACAFLTTLSDRSGYTTLEYKVNITRGIPLDTPVIAEGVVQHAGRRTGVATGKIVGTDNGRLFATGSTTCIVLHPD